MKGTASLVDGDHSVQQDTRLFYGYVMIPVAMLAQICTAPGQSFAISAFIPEIREALELSDTWLTTAYMLGTFAAAFPLMLIGPLADRIGNRLTMAMVVAGLSGACFLASTVQSFAALLIAFTLLRFLGQGALTLLSGNTTSMWFRNKLGRVSAVMSVGMAGAFAVIPPALIGTIGTYGWRNTYYILGATVSMILLPLLLFVYRNRPEDVGQHLDGITSQIPDAKTANLPKRKSDEYSLTLAQATGDRTFWILAISMAAWGMVGTGFILYLLPIGESFGIGRDDTAGVFTFFGFSMLLMQLVAGVLADRCPLHFLLSGGLLLLSAGTICLIFVSQAWHLNLFGVLFGAGQGTTVAVGSTVWAKYYGREHLGKIRGFAWSASVAGSGSGPFFLGLAQDIAGSFQPAMIGFLCLLAPLSAMALLARKPPGPAEYDEPNFDVPAAS